MLDRDIVKTWSPILIQLILSIVIIVAYFAIARRETIRNVHVAYDEEMRLHNARLFPSDSSGNDSV